MSDHLLTWITAFTVLVVLGALLYRSQTTVPQSQVTSQLAPIEQAPLRSTQVKARIDSCRREQIDEKTLVEGYIENIGNADLRYVTLEIQWLNRIGTIIESNEIYVLRDETLSPGQRKTFISSTNNQIATRCNVRKVDWW